LDVYLPIAEMPVNVLLIFGVGAAVGFISGMFGVGGGFLMTPMLIFVGIPPAVVVATEASQIAASSLTGVISYWRRSAVDFKLGVVLAVGGLIGTQLGVMFFNDMRARGHLEAVIVFSYVLLLGGIGVLMLVESIRAVLATQAGGGQARRVDGRFWYEDLPFRMRFDRSGIDVSVIPIAVLSLAIGFAGAVLGIGGGFIMVPALLYGFRVPTHVVVGTSLFTIVCSMTAATVLHATTNYSVDVVLAFVLIVGGVFGAQFGARAGTNLRSEYFRLLLALMIFGVAARFALEVLQRPDDPFTATLTETYR
jgi:uncharacterized protein